MANQYYTEAAIQRLRETAFEPYELQAIKKSIGKWQSIATGIGIDRGLINCSLCKLYNLACMQQSVLEDAVWGTGMVYRKSCPVMILTGTHGCRNSPYTYFLDHFGSKHRNAHVVQALCGRCRFIAYVEMDFLYTVYDLAIGTCELSNKEVLGLLEHLMRSVQTRIEYERMVS